MGGGGVWRLEKILKKRKNDKNEFCYSVVVLSYI